METSILKYVWKHSRSDQLWMLVIILLSMPTYFLSLELPKRIVNGPIQGVGFENPGDTATFLETWLPFGEYLNSGEPIKLFAGFEMDRLTFLLALSFTFLALVVINGLFKMYINTFKGRMGERILRRLRYQLFDRVLRYPISRFRRTKASEVSSMIKDEVEPMGEFIGDAFTLPLFLGGQALTGLTFIFLQNFYLGIVTLIVVLFQAWLIPLLRKRLIDLGKQRQIQARELAGRLGEVVDGIHDAHTNDTTNYERSSISAIMGRLFFIRFELYQRKFLVKFINNFLMQFLAFFFYAVGGYFAIRGSIDIGQLLGVIVAYKDLPDPIRGLIDYDQRRLVVEVRYNQVIEQFAADDLQPAETQKIADKPVPQLSTGYEIHNLAVTDETGSTLIENTSTKIGLGERIAIIGGVNSGARDFGEVLAGTLRPTSGRATLDGKAMDELPENVTGRRIAYIDGSTYFPQNTIFDTLTYVLKNQPNQPPVRNAEQERIYQKELLETRRAGNFDLDFDADWIDYERIGVANGEELIERIRSVLSDIDMESDIRALGLRGTLDPEAQPQLAREFVEARKLFGERLGELGLEKIVELFDPDKYNSQATIGENLLFGTARSPEFLPERLSANTIVRAELAKVGLEEELFELGREVASTTVELFGDLSADNTFFDQLNYMNPDDLPEYRAALARIGDQPLRSVKPADQELILRLPFTYIESKNRLGLLTPELQGKIIEARKNLRTALENLPDQPVSFYEPESYNPASSVLDNVLLGRISSGVAEGVERVTEAIRNLLDEMRLTDDVFRIGLEFNIGNGGKRLSETQRQKLHLARALLKHPDILISNQALNAMDGKSQKTLLDKVLAKTRDEEAPLKTVVWVLMNPQFVYDFDRVLVFADGELVAEGSPDELSKVNETFKELVGA